MSKTDSHCCMKLYICSFDMSTLLNDIEYQNNLIFINLQSSLSCLNNLKHYSHVCIALCSYTINHWSLDYIVLCHLAMLTCQRNKYTTSCNSDYQLLTLYFSLKNISMEQTIFINICSNFSFQWKQNEPLSKSRLSNGFNLQSEKSAKKSFYLLESESERTIEHSLALSDTLPDFGGYVCTLSKALRCTL